MFQYEWRKTLRWHFCLISIIQQIKKLVVLEHNIVMFLGFVLFCTNSFCFYHIYLFYHRNLINNYFCKHLYLFMDWNMKWKAFQKINTLSETQKHISTIQSMFIYSCLSCFMCNLKVYVWLIVHWITKYFYIKRMDCRKFLSKYMLRNIFSEEKIVFYESVNTFSLLLHLYKSRYVSNYQIVGFRK